MALVGKTLLQGGTLLGLWRADETVEQLQVLGDVYKQVCEAYTGNKRRLEVLCTYALLFAMKGDTSLRIEHLPSGKPLCVSAATGRRYYISVSHTNGWVALLLSEERAVAVDIEYVSDRVQRVAQRFLREDEPYTQRLDLQLCWCAKEVAYKYYSEQDLTFQEMRVEAFTSPTSAFASPASADAEGQLVVSNLRSDCKLFLRFCSNKNFVLVYAVEGMV